MWLGLQGVPMADFLTASALATLAVKIPLESVLVLTLFSKPHTEMLFNAIRKALPENIASRLQHWLTLHRANLEPSNIGTLRYDFGVWAWQAVLATVSVYLLLVYINAVANRRQ